MLPRINADGRGWPRIKKPGFEKGNDWDVSRKSFRHWDERGVGGLIAAIDTASEKPYR